MRLPWRNYIYVEIYPQEGWWVPRKENGALEKPGRGLIKKLANNPAGRPYRSQAPATVSVSTGPEPVEDLEE